MTKDLNPQTIRIIIQDLITKLNEMGEIDTIQSIYDGNMSFKSLYNINAGLLSSTFNLWYKLGLYEVFKVKSNYTVYAKTPYGQLNYGITPKQWDLYKIPSYLTPPIKSVSLTTEEFTSILEKANDVTVIKYNGETEEYKDQDKTQKEANEFSSVFKDLSKKVKTKDWEDVEKYEENKEDEEFLKSIINILLAEKFFK